MHGVRNAILAGEPASSSLISTKEACRRKSGGSLTSVEIPRAERRVTNQRREDRHWGLLERAIVVFRRKKLLVRVVNVSSSGLMIEAEIMPRIGETLAIKFEGFDRFDGVVRWIKDGRIGLDIGEGALDLSGAVEPSA